MAAFSRNEKEIISLELNVKCKMINLMEQRKRKENNYFVRFFLSLCCLIPLTAFDALVNMFVFSIDRTKNQKNTE